MKWTFAIQQKLKAATVLCGIMLMIVLFTFLERKNVADMNRSVTSIYNDRLIPATDIFYLSEHLYGKRFLAEQFLRSHDLQLAELKKQLDQHNKNIKSLINRFEKTYLVNKEQEYLNNLRNKVHTYNQIERKIINLSGTGSKDVALALYESEGKKTHEATIKQLVLLTRIQTTVGGELIKDSNGKVAAASMISSLQIVLSIVTGLIIISLIFASKITSGKEQNFHLN